MEDKGLLTGNLWKAIPLFAFPVAATSILEQLSSLIATVVIGQVPGPEGTLGMAAVGANTPIMSLILNLFIGISLGTNVVIANAIGKGDQQTVTRAVHTSVLMSLIGFAVVIIGEIYAEPLLAALSVPAETLPTAALFLRVYLLGMPSILLYNFEAAIFRSVGITRMPLQALMVSTVVNVGLDLVFVPVLHWGVAGLAAASAIAYTLSATTLFYRLTKTGSPVRLDPRKLRVDGAVLARIVRIGLPAGLQSAVFALANTIIQAGINSLGTEVMAASSAAMSLEYVFYNLLNSFSQACTTFVGQAFGARNIPPLQAGAQGLLGRGPGGRHRHGCGRGLLWKVDPRGLQQRPQRGEHRLHPRVHDLPRLYLLDVLRELLGLPARLRHLARACDSNRARHLRHPLLVGVRRVPRAPRLPDDHARLSHQPLCDRDSDRLVRPGHPSREDLWQEGRRQHRRRRRGLVTRAAGAAGRLRVQVLPVSPGLGAALDGELGAAVQAAQTGGALGLGPGRQAAVHLDGVDGA